MDEEEEERRRAERIANGRFDSISEEIRALNSGVIDEPSTVEETDTREPCPRCGRKFRPDRLGKHIGVCKALQEGKEARGVFNASSPMLATPAGGTPGKGATAAKSFNAGQPKARAGTPIKNKSKTGGARLQTAY